MNTSLAKNKRIEPEVLTGLILILASALAIIVANSPLKDLYHHVLTGIKLGKDFDIHTFINDFLMALFFLVAGGEIKHEILHGNLSSFKKASFPVIAAIGGVSLPAIIYMLFNFHTKFANGVGVPISTDIAFAVGIFMMFRKKLDPNLKVFLLSLAVVDDLISIIVIGVAYSSHINMLGIIGAVVVMAILVAMNKLLKVQKVSLYLIVGLVLWFFVYISGVHATISGVLLAMAIPSKGKEGGKSPLDKVIEVLSPLCNFIVLPLFAFSNTGINLSVNINYNEVGTLMSGIILGLSVGKPLGILLFTYVASKLGITEKPSGTSWLSILQVGMLAGIGFTMSIFVSQLAFSYSTSVIDASKISILLAAICSVMFACISIVVIDLKNRYIRPKVLN